MSSAFPGKRFAVVLAMITLVGPLSIHFFLPVLPEVKAVFAISDALAQTTFSVTLATMAFMTLVYGGLSDRYGRRPVLLAGLVLFIAGSTLAAIASTVELLVAARLVQAAGAGCGVALARVIARDAYGPERLVSAIAFLTMAYTLGPMLAPPVGGLLVDSFGWRSVFWAAAAFGALILLSAVLVLAETHHDRVSGAASPVRMIGDFGRLFRRARFAAFVCQSGFSSATFFTLASASAFLMQEYLDRPATEYGLYFFLYPAGYCLGNFLSTRLSGRVRVESMVFIGSLVLALTVYVLAGIIAFDRLTPLSLFVPGFVLSLAQGLALPNAQAGAIRVLPTLAGTAAGAGVFMQMICGGGFSQIYGLLADGTPWPMVMVTCLTATLTLLAGTIPLFLRRDSEVGTAPQRA